MNDSIPVLIVAARWIGRDEFELTASDGRTLKVSLSKLPKEQRQGVLLALAKIPRPIDG